MDRLETFLAATDDGSAVHVTLRALVFHMLEGVAPKLYSARGLDALRTRALEQCAHVGYAFGEPGADPDRLQAGIDAWYLRRVRGLPHAPPDRLLLRAGLETLRDEGDTLYAWLLGELAAHAGLDVRVPFTAAAFKTSRLHESYYLTHLVMLDSVYFTRPLSHRDAAAWGDALAQLVPWLTRAPNPDLAGEVALCLHFMRRPEAAAAKELIAQVEPGEDTHQQATMLMALSAE
jgi:D-amino peptidase